MLSFSKIEIVNFRNISHFKTDLNAKINIIYGENGSGKTSFLEALYHLSVGKSFRSYNYEKVIQIGKDNFLVNGKINDTVSVGIERDVKGGLSIKYAQKKLKAISELAFLVPIQIINSDSYHLIDSGPGVRRQFIDWGVFHVEHSHFYDKWKDFQRIIKQRNAAIKNKSKISLISGWNEEFVDCANTINEKRKNYIYSLKPFFEEIAKNFFNWSGKNIDFEYYSGWDETVNLQDILLKSIDGDLRVGYTQRGPHKANFNILLDDILVQNFLSRGQQKILVCALKIAQIVLLNQDGKNCILLIDDLPSELDAETRDILFNIIDKLDNQVFITGIDEKSFEGFLSRNRNDVKMFHVKQFDNFIEKRE